MKQFRVFNETDGVFASPDVMSPEQASKFIKDFPKKYEQQGYYKTATGKIIDPKEVVLKKRPVTK